MNQWSKLRSHNFTITSGGSYIVLKEHDIERELDTKMIEAQMLRSTPVNIKDGKLDSYYGGWRNASCFKLIPVNFKLREKRWPNTENIMENEQMLVDIKTSATKKMTTTTKMLNHKLSAIRKTLRWFVCNTERYYCLEITTG